MNSVQIVFYTRAGCCLCREALAVLAELQKEFPFEIVPVDISASAQLQELYGRDIPVARVGRREIFRHRADAPSLRPLLAGLIPGADESR